MATSQNERASTTIRVTEATKTRLERLKPFTSLSHGEMVEIALDAYEERQEERYAKGRAALEEVKSNGGESDTSEQ
jgi:predicted transcriptional regulator